MRTIIYFVILIMSAVLLSSCNHRTNIAPVETETIDEEQYYHVPTVYEVLEQRQELKYALWVDSVYLSIPEQILTHMLVTKGTTMCITEIVEEYWNNKEYYHDTILKTMNIQKQYFPDSLPATAPPDKPFNLMH